jgi:two-component system, cell cycle sensor histidine kinase and response regulator CckA
MALIFTVSAVITGCLAFCLFFFQATRKTYRGFGLWCTGVAIMATGYLLFGLRGTIPFWVSVFGGNLAMPIGLLCQLDGIKLFLGLSRSRLAYFVVFAVSASALAISSFYWDSAYFRGVFTSLLMIAVQWRMASVLLRDKLSTSSLFIKVIGSLFILGGFVVLARLVWFALPSTINKIWTADSELVFFVAFLALNLGESLSIIVLNAERVESELLQSKNDLSQTVTELEEALNRQKQAEESLLDSEERYRTFFRTSRDAVFITTVDGKFIDFNKAALEVFGYDSEDREEMRQANVANLYADSQERETHTAIVAKQGVAYEYPLDLRRKDGTIVHALVTTVVRKDERGNVDGFQGTVRDITEHKRMQEALRSTLDRFYTILSSLYSGMLIVTEEGRVEFANQAFCDLFSLTEPPESLQGLPAPEMIAKIRHVYAHPEETVTRIREVVAANLPVRGEQIAISGGRTYMVDYVPVVVGERGVGRVWHHTDITDLKKAEEAKEAFRNQLLQAQKMESIGTLTAGIAHDFNNILTIMNGYTELILAERIEEDPICPDLRKILATGRKGAEMVQRLLAFAKKTEISVKTLDLRDIVENWVGLMRGSFPKIIEIETVFDEGLRPINADGSQIEQVLMNLSLNSKEVMPEGGRLRIEVRNVILDEAYLRQHHGAKAGQHVLLEVSDTGTGMEKDIADRMYDPFFTTKGWDFNKGTGLGLSVAKGIVEQHGGWITCESEQGKGTTFRIYFPTVEDKSATLHPEFVTQTPCKPKKILLVDDEEYVRDLGKRILERAGYAVVTASNGKEALDVVSGNREDIEVVILDLMMPEMGGEKCLEELLKIDPQVKVIVSSGHFLEARESRFFGATAKGFVNKPYEMGQLLEVVREAQGIGMRDNEK